MDVIPYRLLSDRIQEHTYNVLLTYTHIGARFREKVHASTCRCRAVGRTCPVTRSTSNGTGCAACTQTLVRCVPTYLCAGWLQSARIVCVAWVELLTAARVQTHQKMALQGARQHLHHQCSVTRRWRHVMGSLTLRLWCGCTQVVMANSSRQRYCQQCSAFHQLERFDDIKRCMAAVALPQHRATG